MDIHLWRYSSASDSTLGILKINDEFMCYTLEDEKRAKKVFGETRIPAGSYRLKLRTYGSHHTRYAQKFPGIHKGMIELEDVPGFSDILIHIGNIDEDTAGCILVGDSANNNQTAAGRITASTKAYKRIYPPIAGAIEEEETRLKIHDVLAAGNESDRNDSAVVNTDWLNMRHAPGINAPRIAVLSKFTVVEIQEEMASWHRIRLTGWVSGKYLKKS